MFLANNVAFPPVIAPRLNTSFDHFVGARDQLWRHLQAERLGGFQIEDKAELARLLNREAAGARALEDAVDIIGGALKLRLQVKPIGNEPAGANELSREIDGGQPIARRKLDKQPAPHLRERV